MASEIEIEFKQLLTPSTYESLLHFYDFPPPFTQVNHYFETSSGKLQQLGAALRVRTKQEGAVLTLKQPHDTGLLETHQTVSTSEWLQLKETGVMPPGETRDAVISLLEDETLLEYLGSLTTVRTETTLPEGTLVLDRSEYAGRTDYELEMEVADYESGRHFFEQLLESHDLTWNKPPNKIERFFQAAFGQD
ncbi:CYTH domain-containing protein [Alkalicoccus chagannorensis]|uniref:CYTH domain-containing protein n=1 Tax=Alkalicoccus chagannorensis TaxID=427072 RepID=UPI0003FEB1D5|nr:CYTH domain-containing protein [Alkalicoccus chagannorensis]